MVDFWELYKDLSLFQIEEKTFTHTTSTSAHRTEQTVVTQEMRATATVLTTDQAVSIPVLLKAAG